VTNSLRDKLIFHGAIVIILGLLAGFPFVMVLNGSMEGEVRAWRMAHLEGILNGLVCLAAAGVIGYLSLDVKKLKLLAWSLIVMSYGNLIASVVGASTGNRGLELGGPAANIVVFSLFMIAIVGVFIGVGLLALGSRGGGGSGGGSSVPVDVQVSTSPSSTPAPRAQARPVSTAADVEVSVSGADVDVSVDGGDDDEPDSRAMRRRKKRKR
jgi:hypothetical protein